MLLRGFGTPPGTEEIAHLCRGYHRSVGSAEFKIQLLGNLDLKQIDSFRMAFKKRHPITHNLGIIDRKYLEKIRLIETEGRDVNVTPEEIIVTIDLATQILKQLHGQLFK